MAAVILFVVITVAVLAYFKSGSFGTATLDIKGLFSGEFPDEETNVCREVFALEHESRVKPVYTVYSNIIARCGVDSVTLYDKSGKKLLTEGVSFDNPMLKAAGKYLLVADLGGRDFLLFKEHELVWKNRSEMPIRNADVDKRGYVTLITDSKRYNSEVTVIDRHGLDLFKCIIANDYAVSAKISPSGKQMAVNAVSASDVHASTFVKFYGMSGVEQAAAALGEEMGIAPVMWYEDGDRLFVVGNSSVSCIDDDGTISWQRKFDRIYSSYIVNGKRLALAMHGESGPEIRLISVKGEDLGIIPVKDEITNIVYNDGVIGVNCKRKALFLHENGKVKAEYSTSAEITNIFLFNNGQALVVMVNGIVVLDF